MPHVTLGLPVHNGENFVAQAIESILAQTYEDFELIISDNASTDRTEEICRRFVVQDARVRYERTEENLGASRNFNRTVEMAGGKYFKWAAHDDLLEPTYLARSVEVLDSRPDIVLCHCKVLIIDEAGETVRSYDNPIDQYEADLAVVRFGELIRGIHACFEVFGLVRLDVLCRTGLIGSFISSDRVLLAELGLLGKFHEIQEELFLSRDHQSRSIRKMEVHRRAAWFDTSRHRRVVMPFWRSHLELFRCVHRVRPRFGVRVRSYGLVVMIMCRRWRHLRGDLWRAARTLLVGHRG